jgi:hypothetical protein
MEALEMGGLGFFLVEMDRLIWAVLGTGGCVVACCAVTCAGWTAVELFLKSGCLDFLFCFVFVWPNNQQPKTNNQQPHTHTPGTRRLTASPSPSACTLLSSRPSTTTTSPTRSSTRASASTSSPRSSRQSGWEMHLPLFVHWCSRCTTGALFVNFVLSLSTLCSLCQLCALFVNFVLSLSTLCTGALVVPHWCSLCTTGALFVSTGALFVPLVLSLYHWCSLCTTGALVVHWCSLCIHWCSLLYTGALFVLSLYTGAPWCSLCTLVLSLYTGALVVPLVLSLYTGALCQLVLFANLCALPTCALFANLCALHSLLQPVLFFVLCSNC